jgi:hypothetical protein
MPISHPAVALAQAGRLVIYRKGKPAIPKPAISTTFAASIASACRATIEVSEWI